MRIFLLLAWLSVPALAGEFVHAVEFPYYQLPRHLWERELVWLKNVGATTVSFSIPWNWHEPERGQIDLAGATSPRRDLAGLLRLLRQLDMRAVVRTMPPINGWLNSGYPAWGEKDPRSGRQWLLDLEKVLTPRLEKHGGPIAYVDGGGGVLAAPSPPAPVVRISAVDPAALTKSRQALASRRGTIIWEDVEDGVVPAGWEPAGGVLLRPGAVSLAGEERPAAAVVRRSILLMKGWGPILGQLQLQGGTAVKTPAGGFPKGVTAVQLASSEPGAGSAINLLNLRASAFQSDLEVTEGRPARHLKIPKVQVAPNDALWLPVDVSFSASGFCRDCSGFARQERIIYATAELETIEFENGVLAMEFAAPAAGEVLVQLTKRPEGPFVAAGRPTEFTWDEKALTAKLPIPQGSGPAAKVRIGLAIEAPEMSAFFVDLQRLIIGHKNRFSTVYSSDSVAGRARVRVPEGFALKPIPKSPAEIDFEVTSPGDAIHGERVEFAIEADGVRLGRARPQLLRPLTLRLRESLSFHIGPVAELALAVPLITVDPKGGRSVTLAVRNHSPGIQNYLLEGAGNDIEFVPPRIETTVGAAAERDVSFRLFVKESSQRLRNCWIRASGESGGDLAFTVLPLRRGEAVAFSLDLDADGAPEWVLENQRVRAVFSRQDGGRWLEFVWKDSNLNVLPLEGAFSGSGAVEVKEINGGTNAALEFRAAGWKRVVRLDGKGALVSVEQDGRLPPDNLKPGKRNEVLLEVNRSVPGRVDYSLRRPD